MPRPKLAPELIEAIQGAPFAESHEAVAARLGVSVPTVKKYRRELRQVRQEAARARIAEHVEEHVPDALADLTALRVRARRAYEDGGGNRDGQLWLAAIRATLEHVRPEDDPTSEMSDAVDTLERRLAGLAARAGAGGVPAEPDAP